MIPAPSADPFARVPGAVQATDPDEGVPAHYGNPLGEQRHLAERGAIVDLGHRHVLAITDPVGTPLGRRLRILADLGTQSLEGLRRATGAETLLLSGSGTIQQTLHLVDAGTTTWLLAGAADAAALASRLSQAGLHVEDRSARCAVIGTFETAVPGVEAPIVWRDPWNPPGGTRSGTDAAAGLEPAGSDGPGQPGGDGWGWRETIVPRESLAGILAASGDAAGVLAAEALRIEAGRPRFETEVEEPVTPEDLGWDPVGLALAPGTGSEGRIRPPARRLTLLYLDGSESALPRHGAPVWRDFHGSKEVVGAVTSSAIHFEMGPIALALLAADLPLETPVNVDEADVVVPALQEAIAGR